MDEIQNIESVTSEPTTETSSALSDDRMTAEMSATFDRAEARDPSYESEIPEPRYEAQTKRHKRQEGQRGLNR
jgi:hypothetical protein